MHCLFDLLMMQAIILLKTKENAKRLGLPVMFTGRRHGNGLVWFKKPHTIQERRHHEALMTDTDSLLPDGRRLVVRAKRINLPNGREDRNKVTQRSWKEHRKTQYK
jgi:hypothetical protein